MRKLILTSYTMILDGEKFTEQRLVVVNHNADASENELTEKATALVKAWLAQRPHLEVVNIVAYPTIGEESASGPVVLSGMPAYTSKDIPKQDPKEEELSYYVLIDLKGFREQEDFEIGYYDFTTKEWMLKHGVDKDIDLDHMRWMYLPIVDFDK